MSLANKNNVYVVGELVEIKDFKNDVYGNDAQNYVAATIVVKSIVDGQELLTEARTFISEYTTKKTVNKNYAVVKNIHEMLGKKVTISGAQLVSERFWSERTQQLANSTRIKFNLIRLARPTDEDKVTFEFSGFVVRPIAEVIDEDGNVKYYQITLGQANYKEDNMFEVTFAVSKDNVKAYNAMDEKYVPGATVEVNGVCQTIVTHTEKTEPVAFGEPIVKRFTNVDKKFIITGGSDVISGEVEYTKEAIDRLISAYKAEGHDIQNRAGAQKASSPANTAKPKSRASNLAGLI